MFTAHLTLTLLLLLLPLAQSATYLQPATNFNIISAPTSPLFSLPVDAHYCSSYIAASPWTDYYLYTPQGLASDPNRVKIFGGNGEAFYSGNHPYPVIYSVLQPSNSRVYFSGPQAYLGQLDLTLDAFYGVSYSLVKPNILAANIKGYTCSYIDVYFPYGWVLFGAYDNSPPYESYYIATVDKLTGAYTEYSYLQGIIPGRIQCLTGLINNDFIVHGKYPKMIIISKLTLTVQQTPSLPENVG